MPLNELHSSDSGVVYKDNKNKEMNFSSSSSSSSSSDASEEEAQPVSSLELDAENSLLLPEENFLLKALKNAESRAFGIPQEFPFSKVYVKIDWLAAEDTALIKKLFTYFFQHQNIKPIAIEILFSSKITTFDPACITSEQLKNLLTRAFGGNSFLFIGYLSSLSENNLSIDIGKWSDLIFSLIIKKYNLVRDKEKDKGKEKIDKSLINHFACNIDYLHPLSIDKEKLEKLVLFLFLLAIESHQLVALQTWIKKPDYLKIIKEKNNQYYFLYELFKANKDHLKIFFELFKDEPTFFYDKNHNSLLHYSFGNNKSNLKLVFALRPQDINHQNDKGNTVLHLAALNGDLESARFLLVNGANPEIENNDNATFWTIEDLCEPTLLTRYRQYKQKGNALKSPPEVIEHDDLLCAYYAVAYGSGFFHQSAPSLFENSIFLPARKRNTNPKSSSSLHQCHKEFNFPSSCAVFSVKELKKLIEKTTCESAIFDMQQYKECKQEEQYEQFIKVIKNAIAQGFPVFIPFSLDPETNGPALKPIADTAHWAMAFAWKQEAETIYILLVHVGTYTEVNAEQLWNASLNIGSVFPECYLYKEKGAPSWGITTTPMTATQDIKVERIPPTNLSNFIGKLVVVMPPGADTNLLNVSHDIYQGEQSDIAQRHSPR